MKLLKYASFILLGFLLSTSISVPSAIKQYIFITKEVEKPEEKSKIDFNQVIYIESGGKCNSVSTEGAIGHMQIMPITLKEWNKTHPLETYKNKDLFDTTINQKIGKWLLTEQIPLYLKAVDVPISVNHKLIVYNWGIGNFLKWYKKGQNYSTLPKETQTYLLTYWKNY